MKKRTLPQMDRAAEMRLAFDRSFADFPSIDAKIEEDYLAIRLGSEGYALHLSEVAGLLTSKRITSVPSRVAVFIGIAGLRGSIAPVYDLHLLLGHQRADKPNWIAVASNMPVALAFEAFDGHLRIPRAAIVPCGADQQSRHVREFISMGGVIRPIVHLPSILELIAKEAPEQQRRGGTGDV